jgi:hypothetical protein
MIISYVVILAYYYFLIKRLKSKNIFIIKILSSFHFNFDTKVVLH